jgi:hypothetical protein
MSAPGVALGVGVLVGLAVADAATVVIDKGVEICAGADGLAGVVVSVHAASILTVMLAVTFGIGVSVGV